MTTPFLLHLPTTQPIPIIASLPHSGLLVPQDIADQLEPSYQHYLPNQDWHLDKLYDFLPGLGITVLQAIYSRYVVDLNRSPNEPLFGNFWQSIIAEKTAFNVPLYQTLPSQQEIQQRVEHYYHPYHDRLQSLLNQFMEQFGRVYLLDLHSFFGLIEDEICLGNGNGKSCGDRFISSAEAAFCSKGYQVVRNKVFSGGYITQHYGQLPQVEALQVEVRYPVYLNANQLDRAAVPDWKVPEFDRAKHLFEAVVCQMLDVFFHD
ncbi:N-formylglutamate amidohydrolase [Oculatella sp. LEGE 06141]|uniref:N-formylglutamate amidohydrolase n=1 Tax=Oculatella sp. LEGE 06141 TaxID=1828648 RepID=UPI00187ED7BA|nr:N-formylglutamate amidohydrolase [Oculatella sp. LEGE 06141]MBE9177786.1 N-formylglutamate amidohydrolase [Oculatella sp. LEGE 06141]